MQRLTVWEVQRRAHGNLVLGKLKKKIMLFLDLLQRPAQRSIEFCNDVLTRIKFQIKNAIFKTIQDLTVACQIKSIGEQCVDDLIGRQREKIIQRSLSDMLSQKRFVVFFGCCSHRTINEFAIFKDHQRRNAGDSKLCGDLGIVVDVHFYDGNFVAQFSLKPLEYRSHHATRSAPRSPKIDHYQAF